MIFMGLSDIIDQTDPCTLNPSDPVCQQFGTVQDPCAINPAQPFCQQAIASQFPNTQATVNAVNAGTAPGVNPTSAASANPLAASVSLDWSSPWTWGVLAVLVGGGYYLYRKERKSR